LNSGRDRLKETPMTDPARDGDETLEAEVALALDGVERPHAVAMLQAVQARLGYVPLAAIAAIAARLPPLSPAAVWGVATFYNQFRFTPPGRRHVRVCMGTACHVKGGGPILEEWERRLEISDGGVTTDRAYSLEHVACVGCCALAPVTVIGAAVHGRMTPASVDDLLLRHKLEDERARRDEETPR
jgi:NADH-quinone oxidoreductase subunit E